ncbi:hypothetical protein GEV33_007420 [Tenebrio molitor]|uniref:Uncharacterized protein n=1 Tax=Tenebrio molitor TaxID=7067 RepID=A0A8J6HIC5_TENMO|nr:hypothetical protein GEV33_007420 [Tenebrio molitor]
MPIERGRPLGALSEALRAVLRAYASSNKSNDACEGERPSGTATETAALRNAVTVEPPSDEARSRRGRDRPPTHVTFLPG